MSDTKITIDLNGDNSSQIRELHDLQILATFENGNSQANISTTEFEFVNDFASAIKDWIDAGTSSGVGIFEGIPIQLRISDGQPTYLAFDGYLDMTDDFQIVDPTTIKAKIKKDSGLQNLDDLSSGLTWEYLYQEGILTNSDMIWIPYIIEEKFDFVAFLLLSLSIYSLTVTLIDLIKGIAQSTASGLTAIILLGLEIIYALAMIVYLISLINDFIKFIVQPIRFHKGMRLRRLLEIGSNHLNYAYNTTIDEISNNNIVLLPSKDSIDEEGNFILQDMGGTIFEAGQGFPGARDFGYTFGEILTLVNKTFNAKIALKNGTIEQHSLNSSWWLQQSTYTIPDILIETKKYNTEDLSSNRLITFTPDPQDKNIMQNYKGMSYEIITTPITTSITKNVCLKGLDEISIPYSLGIRKNKANWLEKLLDVFIIGLNPLFDLSNAIGGSSVTPVPILNTRNGSLKLESPYVNVPKMLYLTDDGTNQLPSNYHDVWSAKQLYNKYYVYDSFVGSNPNQWIIQEGIKIPFGFEDFLSLIDNSYFYDNNGNIAQITKIEWSVSQDFAIVDYKYKQVYTTNLKETFIEVGEQYD